MKSRGTGDVVAHVQIGCREIVYTRSGQGEPLIILADAPLRDVLLAVFCCSFCVITSVEVAGELASPELLCNFIDALGLARPRMIAQASLATAPLALVEEGSDALAALLVVCGPQCSCGTRARIAASDPAGHPVPVEQMCLGAASSDQAIWQTATNFLLRA